MATGNSWLLILASVFSGAFEVLLALDTFPEIFYYLRIGFDELRYWDEIIGFGFTLLCLGLSVSFALRAPDITQAREPSGPLSL